MAVVALVWGAVRARAGSLVGHIVWLAICPYTAYTDLMYVVTPYNEALVLYIAAIGLATYRLINGPSGRLRGSGGLARTRASPDGLLVPGQRVLRPWRGCWRPVTVIAEQDPLCDPSVGTC